MKLIKNNDMEEFHIIKDNIIHTVYRRKNHDGGFHWTYYDNDFLSEEILNNMYKKYLREKKLKNIIK